MSELLKSVLHRNIVMSELLESVTKMLLCEDHIPEAPDITEELFYGMT